MVDNLLCFLVRLFQVLLPKKAIFLFFKSLCKRNPVFKNDFHHIRFAVFSFDFAVYSAFHNKYLLLFERYMSALQMPQTSVLNVLVFSIIFLLISPFAFCKPYLAWISALQGYSGSIRKVFKKTKGNNIKFFSLIFLLNLPCFVAYGADVMLKCHGWFSVGFYSIYLIYFNIVFAKVYEYFYPQNN